ncbi:MAG TPA: TonB-dependent receptor [Longimicrobium sp.]|nr:TonB-dependent receptor [Longimicrobium sp.]
MSAPSLRRVFALAVVAAALAAPAARAEALAADTAALPAAAPPIIGVVRGEDGVPLPNARVSIAEINRTITTGGDGTFVIRALRPGTYHLDVTLLGYAPSHAVVVVPESGPDVRVEITLRVTALSIEGINVTASPTSADPLNITQSTTELSGKALERNVGTTVAQTLQSQPGMAVRYGGPATSTPVIRGLSGERVLVLQNGQRTGDLSSTSADHGLSIDPLAATRIEVVRGPASLLYGNNALGGVVNVISTAIPTTVPTHAEGYLSAQGESVNPGGALSGEVIWGLGSNWALSVRGGGRYTDDVRVGDGETLGNTQYENTYGVGGIGYVGERMQGGVSVGAYRFDYGLPFAEEHDEEEGEGEAHGHEGVTIRGDRYDANGRLDLALGGTGFTNLRVDGTAQFYGHDEIESNGEVGTRFSLNTQTANVTAKTAFGAFSGAVGVSGLFKQYSPEGEEALTPAADSRNAGLFVYQELPLGGGELAPRLQAGARYDLYRIASDGGEGFGEARSRDFSNLSGSLGLSVPLSAGIAANVSVGSSFRAPTVEELFANGFHVAAGSFDIGDEDLATETNRGIEAVLRAQTGRVNAQLAGFYNRIDNYIFPQLAGDSVEVEDEEEGGTFRVPVARYVQRDAELRGLEGSVEAEVARRIVVGVMGDLVLGDFVGQDEHLPFMPAPRLGASVRWDDGRWSLGAEARHVFEQDRVYLNERATESYELVNLNAGFSLIAGGRVHSITLRVDNLLDELYFDAASRVKDFAANPGRNVSLVYRLLF